MNIGDHIRARRGGRWVHGIDCGDRTVIYYSAGDDGKAGVERARLSEFSAGCDQVQVVTHGERVFPPKMVVARAFSRLRELAFARMFSDSEHFAAWCKSGRLAAAAGSGSGDLTLAMPESPATGKAPRTRRAVRAKARRARPGRAKGKAAPKTVAKSPPKPRPARRAKAVVARKTTRASKAKRTARTKPRTRRRR